VKPRLEPRMYARLLLAMFAAAVCLQAHASSVNAAPEEYALKAAYLYNFVKYIDWPEERFSDPEEPHRVCVVGQDPFGKHLERAVAGKTVRGRGFVLEGHEEVTPEIRSCHLLFVATASPLDVQVLEIAGDAGIITVGEGDFARNGGVASFVRTDSGFRVELNMQAARERGLRVSGRLQQVATLVGE
jgi:YfiR/HmsC-like